MMLHLLMFLGAEGAFILMAVKEYLQDAFHLDDVTLIWGPRFLPPSGSTGGPQITPT